MASVLVCKANAEPSLLTDDETQALLENIIQPIFKVADVPYDKNRIHILNETSLNAFVTDGNHMFVHVGTLMNAKNVNELSGILAHETGHIAGGHVMRQKLKINDMKTLSAISLIAAGGLAVASGRGDAAMAVALGTHGSLLNTMMAYQTSEERAADESAVKYLKKLNQSPQGLADFMRTIQKTNRLSGYKESPYFRTHPMSAERLSFFQMQTQKNGGKTTSDYDGDLRRVQAKLKAFLLPLERVLKEYPRTDRSEESEYAHAIVALREKKFKDALFLVDDLIRAHPENPYFYQLKGQILFEKGEARAAANAFDKALSRKPLSDEIMLAYAEAALEAPNHKQDLRKIIDVLNQLQYSKDNTRGWELLAKAYYEKGMKAESLYAAAKYSFCLDNHETAKKQIKEARSLNLPDTLRIKLNDLENEIKEKSKPAAF